MSFVCFKARNRPLGSGRNRSSVGLLHAIFRMAGLVECACGIILREISWRRHTSPVGFETGEEGDESKAKL